MIGLDGMPWHILSKLFKWNVMPNLKEIAKKSLRGTLKSTVPPVSAPAWTSIATGVNTGKHGIFDFTMPTKDYDGTRLVATSQHVKYLRIHEMVAVQGLRSICINQILTYPIKKIPGSLVITDWLSPEIECSPEIEQYASKYHGRTFEISGKQDWNTEYADLASRVDTINTMLKEVDWNLFWAVYSEPDHLFHGHYDLVMKKDEKLMRLFTKIDETFSAVKEVCNLLIVVSDHGFNKFKYAVYVNTFLKNLGLVKKTKQATLKSIAGHRQLTKKKELHLPERLYSSLAVVPSWFELILTKIYKRLLKAGVKTKLTYHVNPKSSKAFKHGFGVYVKEKELVDYVASILENASFIGRVWRKEQLYVGKWLKDMPDLIVVPNYNNGYAFRGQTIGPKPVVRRTFSEHHPDGIVIIHKNHLKKSWSNDIKVYDIVPTILDFLDLDIPEDTDGRVIDLTQ